ncbi:MAG: zf-TFIIB domain-containing protein [Thermodesulfobacteriota bacterium]|nr:zf-TFIIB domain-containing protein [Thermodesulfobacteriota bacterium]
MPRKPSETEEEYFTRVEIEKKKKSMEEKSKNIASDEKKRIKELHFMRCPKCGMELTEIDYRKIKVDKCFSCQGVWLDAGELEAVSELDRSVMNKFFSIFNT